MYKKIYIFLLCIIFSPWVVWGETTSCTLEENTLIQGYITSTKSYLYEIQTKAGQTSCGESKIENLISDLSGITSNGGNNQGFPVNLSKIQFDFFPVIEQFWGSIPWFLYEQNDRLEAIATDILSTMEYVGLHCAGDVILNGETLKNILEKMYNEQASILYVFQQSIMWKDVFPFTDTYKVASNFYTKLQSLYSKDAVNNCRQQETSFTEIGIRIWNIKKNISKKEENFKEWNEAIKLMKGIRDGWEKYEEIEKKLTTQELKRQGYNADAIEKMMQNLENYGKDSTSGIGAFWSSIFNRVKNSGKDLWETLGIIGDDKDSVRNQLKKTYKETKKAINKALAVLIGQEYTRQKYIRQGDDNTSQENEDVINITSHTLLNIKNAEEIVTNISQDIYKKHQRISFIFEGLENENIEIIANLMKTHNNLIETYENIISHINISEKICKTQNTGMGTCSY